MDKVTAYRTIDGQLFLDEAMAERHEKEILKNKNRDQIMAEKEDWIKNYILTNCKDQLRNENIDVKDIGFYNTGEWGWKCENKDNPIDNCIYSPDTWLGEDMCVFCGEPDERK